MILYHAGLTERVASTLTSGCEVPYLLGSSLVDVSVAAEGIVRTSVQATPHHADATDTGNHETIGQDRPDSQVTSSDRDEVFVLLDVHTVIVAWGSDRTGVQGGSSEMNIYSSCRVVDLDPWGLVARATTR